MSAFEYQALDAGGSTRRGIAQGDSARLVRQQLRSEGLTPLSVSPVDAGQTAKGAGFRGFSNRELSLILRQLASLVGAAQPLDEALTTIAAQSDRLASRRVLHALRARVAEGQSLAAAMQSFAGLFPTWVWSTLAAGEKSGQLESVLERLADHAESRESMLRSLAMSMIYPMLIVLVAILVISAMMVYVVPKVVRVFDQSQQALPWLTSTLITVSNWLQANGWQLVLALLLISLALVVAWRTTALAEHWQGMLLKLPITSRIQKTLNTARFSRTLAMLAGSGVPLLEALPIAAEVMPNRVMRRSVLRAAEQVREGQSLSIALESDGHFTPLALRLIASGEQSGQLDSLLDKTAAIHERDLETSMQGLMTILQPLMILLVGGLVLLIVLAIMLPILNFNQLVT